MTNDEIFAASAAHRLAFADLLEPLTPEQLAKQSLCGNWDVATVGAHLGVATNAKPLPFMTMMVRKGFNFDRANAAVAQNAAKRGIAATIATIREHANSRFTPPGNGPLAPLTDVLVHTGDVARPLGLPHVADPDATRAALGFLSGPKTFGFIPRGAAKELSFVAEDVDMTVGSGAELRGRGVDLMMAMCGRTDALADLSGPGVETLRARLAS